MLIIEDIHFRVPFALVEALHNYQRLIAQRDRARLQVDRLNTAIQEAIADANMAFDKALLTEQ